MEDLTSGRTYGARAGTYDYSLPQTPGYLPVAPVQEGPGVLGVLGAAFENDNTVPALYHLLTRAQPVPDPNFDFEAAAKASDVFAVTPEDFFDVTSAAEFAQREADVREKLKNTQTLAQTGWGGILASIAAGLFDPVNLLPAGEIAKGRSLLSITKTAWEVGKAGAVAAAVNEAVLQADQPIRSAEESAANIMAGAVLGGLLGGGLATFAGKKALSGVVGDMVQKPGFETILPADHPSSIGAAGNPDAPFLSMPDDVQLAPSLGVAKGVGSLGSIVNGPVLRGVTSESKTVRTLTASLDTGGLAFQDLANIGGDVESLQKGWSHLLVDVLRKRDEIMGGSYIARLRGTQAFNEEMTKALRRGATGDTPADEWARYVRQKFFNPLYREMVGVGMLKKLPEEFVANYAPRMGRRSLIQQDFHDLRQIFEEHFSEQLTKKWTASEELLKGRNAIDEESARLVGLSPAEAKGERALLEAQIAELPSMFEPEVRDAVEEIRALREQAKGASRDEAKRLRAQASDLTAAQKEKLAEFNKIEAGLRAKFRLLDRTSLGIAKANAKLFDRIRAVSQTMGHQRQLLLKKLQKLSHDLEQMSEAERDAFFDDLDERITRAENAELAAMKRAGDDLDKLKEVQDSYGKVRDELVAARQAAENLDTDAAAQLITEAQGQLISDANVREAGYREKISKLQERMRSPEDAAAEAKAFRDRATQRTVSFLQRAAKANVLETDGRTINISAAAKELADYITAKMAGEPHIVPFISVGLERGPELSRMLNIDETRVWSNGKKYEDFLENDADIVMRSYLRTVAPDIELMRKFGTVNPLEESSPFRKRIMQEFVDLRAEAAKTLEGPKLEKRLKQIAAAEDTAIRDLSAVVERVRNSRGRPANPNGIGYRAGRAAMNLNTTRMMGKAVIASVPDVAAIMFRHGVVPFFRDGLVPMIANLRSLKPTLRELQIAGTANDLVLHGRSAAFGDVFDSTRALTKGERFLQYAASHMGMLSGMDAWNTGVKLLAGHVTMLRLADSLEHPTARNIRYLNRFGITPELASEMSHQLRQTGTKQNGLLIPNLEEWGRKEWEAGDVFGYNKAVDARRAFQAAIARDIDDTIITPGAERPLWMDGSTLGRMVGQFRTFTASATTKMLIAGAQNVRAGDMAPLTAVPFLLASGALSYYIWAMTTSQEAQSEMQNASFEKWAQEMVTRAIPLGVLGEAPRISESLLGASILPAQNSKYAPRANPFNLAGPSAALAQDIVTGLSGSYDSLAKKTGVREGEPGLSESETSALRRLLPYNNLLYLARINQMLFQEMAKQ